MKNSIYLWKYYFLKRRTYSFYRELLKNQYLSQDEIEAISWSKTKMLIEYAYENVPYYHDKYKAYGIHPNDIKTQSDFQRIPLLTKEDIRNNLQKLISRKTSMKDLNMSATGGSTGHVLTLYHQKNIPRAAIGWRMLGWWRLSPCCDSAWIWRMGNPSFMMRTKLRILEWPSKSIRLNAGMLDEKSMREFIEKYNRSQIELIHGYVGAVDHLASFILENKIAVRAPKAISVTASPITTVQEKRIETAFDAPVYDQYGCCEVFWLAAQCSERKFLHRFHDTRRIEFLDDNGSPCKAGVEGRIVVTNLESLYFPVIRYVNGDMGMEITGECRCGVKLPLMGKVCGRVSENIKLPDSTIISGPYLTTIFDPYPEAVRQFQVYQRPDGSIEIRYVPFFLNNNLDLVLEKIMHGFRENYGDKIQLDFVECNQIPHERGKFRYIISDYKK